MTTSDKSNSGSALRIGIRSWEFFRFLLVGASNTVVGYATYLLLLQWLSYELAYAIGFLLGIAVSYVLSTAFVFRQPMAARSALQFPLVYVVQFILSIILLKLAVQVAGIPSWAAPVFAIVITSPVTFLLSRLVIRSH